MHAGGVLVPRLRLPRRHVEPPVPLRTVIPVSFDETPASVEEARSPAPPAPASPPPAVIPAEPRATVPASAAVPPRPASRPPTVAASARPAAATREPRPANRHAERGSPFVGTDGAFRASVCLLPRSTRSARAVENCTPIAGFRTNTVDVSPRRFTQGFPGFERRSDWFGVDYRGRFTVRAAGYFTLRLLSDDGALLFVDGELVIDNDGQHSAQEAKMSLPLAAGEHDFRLLYYQGPGDELALQLFVTGYKTEERLFGPKL